MVRNIVVTTARAYPNERRIVGGCTEVIMAELDERARAELLQAIAKLAPADAGGDGDALRAIVANVPAMLIVVDPIGRIVWVNRPTATLGHHVFDYVPSEDHTDVRTVFERVVQTRRPDRFTGYGPGTRGPRSRYETWISPIIAEGRVIALALAARDVSEQWELYEALRDREERLSIVLRAAGMGTWRFDLRTKTVELDERARAIYGLTAARLDSLTFTTTHVHPDDRAEVDKRALASVAERRPYTSQNRIVRSDGQVRWVEITGSPILDDNGAFVALMGTVSDITERRELETRARQAQRLDAVGSLTAGIAHNFNNVLAAIMPALSLIERDVKPSALPLVRGASLATERAADLVRQLMTFAGRNSRQVTVESPGVLVERTVALCRSTFDRAIELRISVDPNLPSIRADAGQIEQALLNLLLNARDAVGETGRVDPMIRVRVTRDGSAIAIVVEDNGTGVPDALRDRIFDPFFTTKPVGAGTGLGLATAYAIAREHGGDLTYSGELGRGAQFTLLIPAVDVAPEVTEAVPRSPVQAQGTVLVVDDDPFVRESVTAVLVDAGFTVLAAESADQAMVVLAGGARIDVVLLDINMPGSSWRTVVHAIRQAYPTTRIVAFTGGIAARDNSVDGWLAKPAHPEAIIEAINTAIVR
jgi:PAS domain S-box-containing protein